MVLLRNEQAVGAPVCRRPGCVDSRSVKPNTLELLDGSKLAMARVRLSPAKPAPAPPAWFARSPFLLVVTAAVVFPASWLVVIYFFSR